MNTQDHEVIDKNGKRITRGDVLQDGDVLRVPLRMIDAANPLLAAAQGLERSRTERSSPTIAEMKGAATRFVEQLATDGTPRLIMEHGKFDLQFGRGTIASPEPSPAQVLAWVDPKAVLKRLHEQIDEAPKATNSMTFEARKKRLNEISGELFELERVEQAHIEAALIEGTVIEQRPNCDIRALLGLVIIKDKIAA
jgi:hypothetical protein